MVLSGKKYTRQMKEQVAVEEGCMLFSSWKPFPLIPMLLRQLNTTAAAANTLNLPIAISHQMDPS